MGKEGIAILNLDVQKLIDMLNVALSEEWLAYYQYWIGASIVEGPMRSDVEAELRQHANEELGHANRLVNRIIQLNGNPVLDPAHWTKLARCKYEAPTEAYVQTILTQNLTSERCAILRYQEIADFTDGVDHVTHELATAILAEELEHERELEDFLTDIAQMKKNM